MKDLEIIKHRIKKLLALSKSPNENEAISAMEKANALISEYGFSQTAFTEYSSKTVKSTKRAVEWRIVLANAVERLYATYHYRNSDSGTFVFYGEELDVFMSTEMLPYLMKSVERMARVNVRKNAKYRYRQSYKSGIASRLWDRMDELGSQCSWRNPEELEKKKSEIAEWVENQVTVESTMPRKKVTQANMKAFMRGTEDADGISLSRQMPASHGRLIEGKQ